MKDSITHLRRHKQTRIHTELTPANDDTEHGETFDLERLFDLSLDMLCIAGMDGMLKRINPSFERILGWTEAELLSRRYIEFVHPDDLGKTLAEMDKLADGMPTVSFENRYRCADGRFRHLSWTSFPDPGTGLLYAVARDISDGKEDQRQLRLLAEELEWANARLLEIATTDPLTHLSNRRKFDSDASALIQLMARMKRPVSLIMADIDHFKAFNDAHGHLEGDAILEKVAELLEGSKRDSDLVARFGGEEFIILLPDTAAAPSVGVAEGIRTKLLHHPWPLSPVTMSFGITTFYPGPERRIDPEELELQLIEEADQALYHSKNHGRNRVSHYSETSPR